ncbi:hypothetical protein KS4_34900 [Poriferisphaera corsica]|uniref:Lipoprotein n=1 Tax=Poriferisphaera corsica TaxID=2528020 RepID=A0A517YYZ0_9BACT|nr:hypothetical protein [Poriferisphaera corsica]QDU35409.1 hypothetical protein KS4_34900 [Poriferisphaera corsica]
MRQILPLIVLSLLLFGCVSPKYNYIPTDVNIQKPDLMIEQTAYVGDEILKIGNYKEYDAIHLDVEATMPAGLLGYVYKFSKGNYIRAGFDERFEYYLPGNVPNPGSVDRNPIADPFLIMQLDTYTSDLYGVTIFKMRGKTTRPRFTRTKVPSKDEDYLVRALTYNGTINNAISISYNEYAGPSSRPLFTNQTNYDISEDDIIGYQGARLRILEATNEYIRYQVLNYFQ